MIEVDSLIKRFGSRTVLEDISLTVDQGEVVAVMGSSGGGKTTLLKCISGLLGYEGGSVRVDNIDVSKDPEGARKKLGLVFQSAALFDYLNVWDNVCFGLRRLKRQSKAEERAEIEPLLEKVGLSGSESLMPAELSGGMRKRVGLARALACKPAAILYDEPTTGLDPVTVYTIDSLIEQTRKEFQVASLVVSHDLSSVYRVADKVAFLEAGRLTFYGTTQEFGNSDREAIQELIYKAESRTLV